MGWDLAKWYVACLKGDIWGYIWTLLEARISIVSRTEAKANSVAAQEKRIFLEEKLCSVFLQKRFFKNER